MSAIKNFLGTRVEELDIEKQCLNRTPIDSLICVKFDDGHIHYQLPSNTSVTEFISVLYNECQKEEVQSRERIAVSGFKENTLQKTKHNQVIDIKAEPIPIKPKEIKKEIEEAKNENRKTEEINK